MSGKQEQWRNNVNEDQTMDTKTKQWTRKPNNGNEKLTMETNTKQENA